MTSFVSTARPSAFAVFRRRSFRLLWTAQLVSTSGSALTSLAAGILVYRLTGSALSVGLMLMATAVPTLLFGLIAGVFVDRYDRKRIMIAADLIRAALVFLIPFVLPFGITWLYVLVLLSSAVTQFFDPANESVLPDLASDEELAAANALMAISSFGSTAIGFAAAGLIASQFPIAWVFYLDALSFVVSALCIGLVRIAPLAVDEVTNVTSVMHNLRAGVRFLSDSAILRSLLIVSMTLFLSYGLWNVLLLPFALRALHATEFEYGLQEGLTSVGFVLGSLLMARIADRLREGQWIAIGVLGMAIVGVAYALVTSILLAIVLVMVSGFLNAPSAVGRRLVIQRNTPREMRGRVNSAFFVARDLVFLIGMAVAGLADVVDVRMLMFGAGVLLGATGLLALILPGLGQPAREWRRAVSLLRGAQAAPGLGPGRGVTLPDLDRLVGHIPALAGLSARDRQELTTKARIYELPAGAAIVRRGETSSDAYFILDGRAVAGREDDGSYQSLEVLNAGDFFGEIAALTGVPRTADVLAEQPTTVLQVPAATLRQLMSDTLLNRLFLSRMTERMVRMHMIDLPRFGGLDQESLRELRTPDPQPTFEVQTTPAPS
jgi:MFS family permease